MQGALVKEFPDRGLRFDLKRTGNGVWANLCGLLGRKEKVTAGSCPVQHQQQDSAM